MTALDTASMVIQLPITIRLAKKADLVRLEWYGQYTHYRHVLRRSYREQKMGRRFMLVADCNGFPIGCIFIQLKSARRAIADGSQRAYLYSLRVMEMFRGMGIGTRLIQEAEALVMERGFRWTTIAVAKDNPDAQRLYERLGYRIFAEDPGHWSYIDHQGQTRRVHEPCWILEKCLYAG